MALGQIPPLELGLVLPAKDVMIVNQTDGCGHLTRVPYQDELVKITERSTVNFLNVHGTLWPCFVIFPDFQFAFG